MSEGKTGNLDAVEMMRSIRNELSRKLQDMTHEEQRRYIREQLARPEPNQGEKPERREGTTG